MKPTTVSPAPSRRRDRRQLALAVAVGGMSSVTFASGSFEEDIFFEPLPVVLTASRLPQSLEEAPGAITVIDRQTIDASHYRNIPRLLRAVPGMHIGYERGGTTWVSYHGIGLSSAGEMQILVNGATVQVPVNFGAIEWSGLPIFLSEVDQIEVVRGASANSFGGTSLVGTANLITRPIDESPGLSVRTLVGDPSIRDVEAAWAGRIDQTALRVIAGEQHDDGFKGLTDTRTTQRISVSSETRVDPNNILNIRLGGSSEHPQRGYPDSPLNSNGLRTADDRSHLVHLRWQHIADADNEWSASVHYQRLRFLDSWYAAAGSFTGIPLSRNRQNTLTSYEFQARHRISDALRGVWGVSTTRDRIHAPEQFIGDHEVLMRSDRGFANLEWQATERMNLNLGLAVEDSGLGWRASPRVYASYHARPGTTLRLGASRVWRNPTMFERKGEVEIFDPVSGVLLTHPYTPNPNLRHTRADTIEAGLIQQFEDRRTTVDVRVFRERLEHPVVRTIVPDAVPLLGARAPTTQFINDDNPTTLTGLELQLSTRPWRGGNVRLAWSVIDREAGSDAAQNSVAPYSANLIWQQEWPDAWTSFVSITRIGPVASGESYLANERYVVDDFTTVDISVSRPVSLFGQRARFSLTALDLGPRHQEIADPSMQSVYGNRAANRVSRQVYAGLSMQF